MRRIVICLSFMMTLLGISVIPTVAQTPDWEAWMYNFENGRMVLVGSDNIVYDDFTLPGLQGNDYSWQAVVAPDGRTIAYSLFNTFNQVQSIYIYSTVSDSLIATYVIPSQQGQLVYHSLDLNPTSQMFSPDGASIAIGYTIEQAWSLVVIDLVNQPGTVLAQLSSANPIASNVESAGFDVPTVAQFDGTTIDFMMIAAGTEGFPSYPHYTYNLATNSLTQNYYFVVPWGDYSKRDGRYVFAISDYRLPNNNASYQGFGQQTNALHQWTPGLIETFPIFNAPNHTIGRATYIQNDEKIMLTANDWVTGTSQWWAVEPASLTSTVITPLDGIYPSGMVGVGDGFVASVNTNDIVGIFPDLQGLPDRSALIYFNTRASSNGTVAQQVWFGGENRDFKLVWAQDNLMDTRPAPPAWNAIGAPSNASNFGSLFGIEPPPDANTLQIGGQARIFTTEGDRANMRRGPGTNFSVVAQLANDTLVTILEGPETSGGFTWWRVQSETDAGWVVESADGVRVLQTLGGITPATVSTPVIADNPPGNLSVGGFAVVTAEGNNLNARQQASTSAAVVTTFQTNERLSIIGGTIVTEGFTWWQVDTQFGPAWVAEGTATEKWIVPST